MRNATRLGVVFALGTATVLGACGGNKGGSASTDSAGAGAGTTASAGGTAGGAAAGGATGAAPAGAGGPTTPADSTRNNASPVPTSTARMTDPEIVSIVQAANEGEIMTSQVASTKATNPDVRKFADQMRREHTQMISQGNALSKAQNLAPAKGARDSAEATAKTMTAMLQKAPKGMAFDTAYINGQVIAHQATLTMVQKADSQAQNAALKQMLAKAAPEIQQHLNEAKALQAKLAGGTSGNAAGGASSGSGTASGTGQ